MPVLRARRVCRSRLNEGSMAQQRSFQIGFSLYASALLGAFTLLIGLPAETHARPHHRVHAMHLAPANNSSPASNQNVLKGAQKSGEHVAPNPGIPPEGASDSKQPGRHSVGNRQGGNEGIGASAVANPGEKEIKSPGMKDLGPVDTSITTVRPLLHAAKAETTRVGASRINSKIGKHFRTQRTFVQHRNRPVVRNTIGVPIATHDLTPGQHAAPASVPTGVKAGAVGVIVKSGPGVGPAGVFHPNAGLGLSEAPGNRGAISGSGFTRRGFVPAALGGQMKTTGGLSGSMIRPKY
jgi:hypothetical protein